ncbi:exonuclease [Trichuris suis]|nr:exonuclease [Trichuris suis]
MKQRKRPLENSEESELLRRGKKVIRSTKDVLYDYYCVIDFECTCEEHADIRTYPHEIIEFPAILIDARTRLEVAEFHSYCRPVQNARLSRFCESLTGIHQETVDKAPLFEDVVNDFQAWLARNVDDLNKNVAFVVDGPTDFGRFLQYQYSLINQEIPDRFHQWIDIRIAFQRSVKATRPHLMSMLKKIGESFEGRRHSGMDDARNIAKIAVWLLEHGFQLQSVLHLFRQFFLLPNRHCISG